VTGIALSIQASHRARKRFGQNFLHDPGVIGRILDAISPDPSDHLVEIGPGQGAITRGLLESGCLLDAIELDRDLVQLLQQEFGKLPRFRLHNADALKFDFCSLQGKGELLRIVGNLPYNISTPLLFHLLDQARCLHDMHFMLQPKVESAFVRLTPWREPPHPVADFELFSRIVSAAFSQRRKTLRNTLKPLVSSEVMEKCGVEPALRAEQLSPADFACLANACTT